jgi:hypothetical protein
MRLFDHMAEVGTRLLLQTGAFIIISGRWDEPRKRKRAAANGRRAKPAANEKRCGRRA